MERGMGTRCRICACVCVMWALTKNNTTREQKKLSVIRKVSQSESGEREKRELNSYFIRLSLVTLPSLTHTSAIMTKKYTRLDCAQLHRPTAKLKLKLKVEQS